MRKTLDHSKTQGQESLTTDRQELLAAIAAGYEEEEQEMEELKDIEHFLREHPEKAKEEPTTTLVAWWRDVVCGEGE